MRTAWRLSIKTKLMMMFIALAGLTSALSMGFYLRAELKEFGQETREELRLISGITAYHSAAAVAFEDQRTARETLATLSFNSSIEYACLYSKNGAILAEYGLAGDDDIRYRNLLQGRNFSLSGQEWEHLQADDSISLFKSLRIIEPILLDRELVGLLLISANVNQARAALFGAGQHLQHILIGDEQKPPGIDTPGAW